MKRHKVDLPGGARLLFPNRKRRKANMMYERFALAVFADNAPYHRLSAKSASIETIVKALEEATKQELEQRKRM